MAVSFVAPAPRHVPRGLLHRARALYYCRHNITTPRVPQGEDPMNSDVIITCAITGDDTKVTKSRTAPSPRADREFRDRGGKRRSRHRAHPVRDPETGEFSMATRHYREW